MFARSRHNGSKLPQLYEDEAATKARATLRNQGLRILPVVDEEGKIIGIVDRKDVVKALL